MKQSQGFDYLVIYWCILLVLVCILILHGQNREPMPDPIKGFDNKPSVKFLKE